MGPHQRVSRGKRKDKQRKCSRNEERWWTCWTLNNLWCLGTLLLLCLPAAASLTVEGPKGGIITLPCSCTANVSVLLTSGHLIVYGVKPHKLYEGRVHRSFQCDIIIQDLKTTDAGNYTLRNLDNGDLIPKCYYSVTVNVNLTGHEGKELRFDERPRGAERVVYSTGTGVQGKEVWKRGKGVLDKRLRDNKRRLTISNFTASDAGAYRVLDEAGGILNTIMVTESEEPKDINDDETGEAKRKIWVLLVAVSSLALLVLVPLTIFAVKKRQSRLRNKEWAPVSRSDLGSKSESKGFEMQAVNQTNN